MDFECCIINLALLEMSQSLEIKLIMTKYLDRENCRALLPDIENLPLIDQLENCLSAINDNSSKYQGLLKKLRKQNSKSSNYLSSTDRLLPCSLDIAIMAYPSTGNISVQARQMPDPSPCRLNIVLDLSSDTSWRATMPLQFLLKDWGDANKGYQGYTHVINHSLPRMGTLMQMRERQANDKDSYYYVGITGRNWLQRLKEHYGEIKQGSRKKFHRAWRESMGMNNVLIISELRAINMSYEEAMNWEEERVDKIASDEHGLNMIPGGFKGLRLLHKLGITSKVQIPLDERERAIDRYIQRNPRKGIPNLFVKALWEDDSHYLKVISGQAKLLTPSQVYKIRELNAKGLLPGKIAEEVGALNIKQVKKVISGRTYRRIEKRY